MNQYFKQTLTKSDIFTQPTELDETLKGLPRGEVGVLVAPGATGKSFFVLNMLLASCHAVVKNHLIVLDKYSAKRLIAMLHRQHGKLDRFSHKNFILHISFVPLIIHF